MISAPEVDDKEVEELKQSGYLVVVIKKHLTMKSLIEKIEVLTRTAA